MESSNMKNMVVLKNLPSNMVEEAIIIFKKTQKVKEKEAIEKLHKIDSMQKETKSKDYILKEAEMLVNDYIKQIESKKNTNIFEKSINNKYNFLKKYSTVITILFGISLIINFI